MSRLFPTFSVLLTAAVLFASAGCCGFSSRWNALAAAGPRPTASDTSRWEGEWKSDRDGHSGKLRCIVSKIEYKFEPGSEPAEGLPTHSFEFSATWGLNFVSGYTIDMIVTPVTPEGDTQHFKGSFSIVVWPLIDDTYHAEGTIEGDSFKAKYHAEIDDGIFEMKRVRGKE